jgi:hypothetical protein
MSRIRMTEATTHGLAPTVQPDELRDCWEDARDFTARHPGSARGRGAPGGPEYSPWAGYRASMLQISFMHPDNPLASWRRGNDLDDIVFRVAAEFPMMVIGEGIHHGLPFDVEGFLTRLTQ